MSPSLGPSSPPRQEVAKNRGVPVGLPRSRLLWCRRPMDPALTSDLISAAITVAGVGGTAALGFWAVRRARARRQREIEGAGEARPALSTQKRRGLQAEDLD